MSIPHVSLTFFYFSKNHFWAFRQMGVGYRQLKDVTGLRFKKLLGTGGGDGFSLRPDFRTYAFLGVWDSAAQAQAFLDTHPFMQAYYQKAAAHRTLHLKPYKSSGLWDGKNPFTPASQQPPSADQAVAILTRASLRWNRLAAFWKAVPAASKALSNAQGVQFYKGIGEWPWIQQATVSIWNQAEAVHQFAYKGPHAKIVKKTRQQQWYAEDLFARFVLLSDTQKIKHL
jgi:heme-degrading monooxygenase HmoA